MSPSSTGSYLKQIRRMSLGAKALVSGFSLALLMGTTPASAYTVTYTYTGTVKGDGYDINGYFGPAYQFLRDYAFTAVETFETTKIIDDYPGAGFRVVDGGPYFGGAPGFGTATITINGSSPAITIDGEFTRLVNVAGSESATALESLSLDRTLSFTSFSPSVPYDYTKPYVATLDQKSSGVFSSNGEEILLQPLTLTVTTSGLSAVPLPASLPLFAGSLMTAAALGRLVRRRSRDADLSTIPA